jgi:hypothetical protein
MGSYLCYDLTKIFNNFAGLKRRTEITERRLEIPSDPFLQNEKYADFLKFRVMKRSLLRALSGGYRIVSERSFLAAFVASNPASYEVYNLTGDYFRQQGDFPLAVRYYRRALGMMIPTEADKRGIVKNLADCIKQK